MTDDEAMKAVHHANLALAAVIEAMNSDDFDNVDRYLDLYAEIMKPVHLHYGNRVSSPVIELLHGHKTVH